MKWVYKITFGLLLAVIIASAAASLYYYTSVNDAYLEESAYVLRDSDPEHHFSLILNADDDIYWRDFKKGAFEAGKVFDVAIEFNPVSEPDRNSQIVEYINIANKSQVDGIIVAGKNTEEYTAAINDATAEGINIVVGEFETVNSDRLSYVGTNYYEYGVEAARLIAEAGSKDKPVNLAVILSSESAGMPGTVTTSQNDIMMNGLKSVLINIVSMLYRSNDLLGAEDLIRSILTEHPDIDVIFCTNAKDTVAAAHIIVERNLVGKVAIVGTDIDDEIANYIKKGVITGVVDRNGYDAGYKSVETLYASMGQTFQSSYIDINAEAYTVVNISTYEKH